jgi:hypothetical protein
LQNTSSSSSFQLLSPATIDTVVMKFDLKSKVKSNLLEAISLAKGITSPFGDLKETSWEVVEHPMAVGADGGAAKSVASRLAPNMDLRNGEEKTIWI